MTPPAWLAPGRNAVILEDAGVSQPDRVVPVTIVKVGVRDVVVEGDGKQRRFSTTRLTEHGTRSSWSGPNRLVEPSDPAAVSARVAWGRRDHARQLDDLADQLAQHARELREPGTTGDGTDIVDAAAARVRHWLDGLTP